MEWLKKVLTSVWFYLILFVISIIVPFIINELYKIGEGYITDWVASDTLSFYGNYLSFFGTVVLGAVAIFQTERANEQTERANNLSLQMQRLECAKFISIVSLEYLTIAKRTESQENYRNPDMPVFEKINLTSNGFSSTKYYHIDTVFENKSEYPIVEVVVHAGDYGSATNLFYGIKDVDLPIYIPPNQSAGIRFIVPFEIFDKVKKYNLSLRIGFINIFDYLTKTTIGISDLESSGKKNNYFYRIAKYTDINPFHQKTE